MSHFDGGVHGTLGAAVALKVVRRRQRARGSPIGTDRFANTKTSRLVALAKQKGVVLQGAACFQGFVAVDDELAPDWQRLAKAREFGAGQRSLKGYDRAICQLR